jgi:hypothetical protein
MDYSYYTFWCKILLYIVGLFGVRRELKKIALVEFNHGEVMIIMTLLGFQRILIAYIF